MTDNSRFLDNVKVNDDWHLCKSDHYPVTFNVKFKAKRRQVVKREIYNFKRASWDSINNDLRQINWDRLLLFNDDIEFSWNRFNVTSIAKSGTHATFCRKSLQRNYSSHIMIGWFCVMS